MGWQLQTCLLAIFHARGIIMTINLDDYIFDTPHHIQRDEGCQAMEEDYWGCWGRRILDGRAFYGQGATPEEATKALKQNILDPKYNPENHDDEVVTLANCNAEEATKIAKILGVGKGKN